MRSMALITVCEVHPIQNLRVLVYLKNNLKQSDDDLNLWARHWIIRMITPRANSGLISKARQVLLW